MSDGRVWDGSISESRVSDDRMPNIWTPLKFNWVGISEIPAVFGTSPHTGVITFGSLPVTIQTFNKI